MRYRNVFIYAVTLAVAPFLVAAHQEHTQTQEAKLFLAALERNRVSIERQGDYFIIESNGVPDHVTGDFPNRNNPNSISAQRHRYRIDAHPQLSGDINQMRNQPFGVAVNGIPFDPGTAECYGVPRGSRPSPNCQWRQEAIVNGKATLGLDSSNAHVQPNGTYHYHGIPAGLIQQIVAEGDLIHVGYAADGFRILVSVSHAYDSSFKLKQGSRPDGPGGAYDGTYTQDFIFVADSGHLDQCNGTMIGDEYAYVLTSHFPYIPRCWRGEPDSSFGRAIRSRPPMGERPRGRPPHGGPPHIRRF